MTKPGQDPPPAARTFAWDGVSFLVPGGWHLAGYSFGKNVTRVQLEDDYALRLEAEWTRPRRPPDLRKVESRFSRASKRLVRAAKRTDRLDDVLPGGPAFLYTMPDGAKLLTAFLSASESTLSCFLRIHFQPDDRETPRAVLSLIATGFRAHVGATVPWSLYDISIELPSDFRLVSTSLQAGRKLLVFQWRLRRFYIWHFSLANILLRDRTLEEWAAEFLNSFKGIRGPTFIPGANGTVLARRRWPYVVGHFEEIGRWCFRYQAKCVHDPKRNRVILWAYNYRRPEDVEKIPASLRAEAASGRTSGKPAGTAEA